MRFKTFRNFIAIPGSLIVGILIIGSLGLLISSSSCGSTNTDTPRVAERREQPITSTPTTNSQPIQTSQSNNVAGRDAAIVAMLDAKRNQSGDKIKDALPREAYKVNVYRDGASPTWNRLKVDYDRDEKWDEKWDLEDGRPAKKQISTADNDSYDKEYRWQGGQWVEKKQ